MITNLLNSFLATNICSVVQMVNIYLKPYFFNKGTLSISDLNNIERNLLVFIESPFIFKNYFHNFKVSL